MPEQFVTVLRVWSVEAAHLARIRLANEGIEARLENNQSVGMDFGQLNAGPGVGLVVKQADAERAREILESEPGDLTPSPEDDLAEGVDVNLGPENEVDPDPEPDKDDDEDAATTGMSGMRSVGKIVVVLFLVPWVLWLLAAIGNIVIDVIHSFSR